jgi:hypothetical protein
MSESDTPATEGERTVEGNATDDGERLPSPGGLRATI